MPLFTKSSKKKTEDHQASSAIETENSYTYRDNRFSAQKDNQSMLREIHEKIGLAMIPRRRDIERMFGKPNKNSNHYPALLESLDKLNDYLNNTELARDPNEMNQQLDHVLGLMGDLEQAVMNFVDAKGKKEKRAVYMKKLMIPAIRNVRVNIVSKIVKYRVNPPDFPPKLYLIAYGELTRLPRTMDPSMKSRESASGALNTVNFFKPNFSEEYVFKKDKKTLTDEEDDAFYAGIAKIDIKKANFAKRNLALYRLDKLLGGNLIPKTELAMRVVNNGKKPQFEKGTIMQVAKGVSAKELVGSNRFVKKDNTSAKKDGSQQPNINITDPNLQRLLSRLSMLDALAMQIDRHLGNYFIEFDEDGNVTGVKGIDNDLAFGTMTSLSQFHNYAGLNKLFLDKDMAQRILALRNEDLQAVLGDLLSPEEMQALFTRLDKLKKHISSAKLLEPHEWNDTTAELQADEKKDRFSDVGYYGDLYAGWRM